MIVVPMSTRSAATAYLFFLLVSLANTAILNRSSDEWSSEDPINDNKMYENLIEDEDDYPAVVTKPITMFDILKKRILTQKIAPPESAELMITPFRKRTCYFNAGMSHSCDYKELLQSVEDVNHWSSEHTPGRRRKRHPSSRGRAPTQRSTNKQQQHSTTF
uniref:Uncharacterized protein n=1 Tax=Daphnia galeata TaxID=27404 RepID=A0A8J2RBD6_9CRUS|nr:unnamed protein product [Daphnia galeata]